MRPFHVCVCVCVWGTLLDYSHLAGTVCVFYLLYFCSGISAFIIIRNDFTFFVFQHYIIVSVDCSPRDDRDIVSIYLL